MKLFAFFLIVCALALTVAQFTWVDGDHASAAPAHIDGWTWDGT